jgi:myo-inositol-1(or 4)-monophosphatase
LSAAERIGEEEGLLWVPKAAGIAREAGARLREFFARGVETEYKGDVDLVTVADRTSEALIKGRLAEAFPEHGIYGEEGTRERMEGEFRWYVDPLDGTTNFAHGFPQFCVSLGLEQRSTLQAERGPELAADEDGKMVAGVIYDPMRDELFTAERGKGATLNGKTIWVSKTEVLAESLVATGFPSRKRHDSPNMHFYHEFTLRSHGVRRAGSAALDLAYVACGRLEAFWEFNLNPWDTAAGALLVEEAGGRISGFGDEPFELNSREVLASNGRIHGELVGLFKDMFAGRNMEPIPTPQEFARRRAERAGMFPVDSRESNASKVKLTLPCRKGADAFGDSHMAKP